MSNTWVIAADSCTARFFVMINRQEWLQEFKTLVHSEGKLHEKEQLSDRRGGIAGGHGEGDHTFEAPTDYKHHEAEVFAKQIETVAEHGRVQHEFDKLILIAPPAFLGLLRQTFNQHLLNMVGLSLDKNLVKESESIIQQHIS